MDIKPIKSEADYEAVLAEIAELMNAEPGTEEGDRLDVLATLVEAYEAKAHPIDAPDPIEAIRHRMEALGMSRQADLEPFIGKRWRVSEVMNRKRPLTLNMIRRLNEAMGISAETLIRPYQTEKRPRA